MKGTVSFEYDDLPQPKENRQGYSVWEWRGVQFHANRVSNETTRFHMDIIHIEPSNRWAADYTKLASMTDVELLKRYNEAVSSDFDHDNVLNIIYAVRRHYDNSLDLFNELLTQEKDNPKLASEILSSGYFGFEGVAQAILYRLICAGAFQKTDGYTAVDEEAAEMRLRK